MSRGEAESNTTLDDLTLARQAAGGDAAAFNLLVDRHSEGLFRMCHSMTKTRSDAEDLLQETFVGAFNGLKNFNGASSVKTWLTSILMRQAAKAWHRNRHHRQTRSIDSGSMPSDGSPQMATSAIASASGWDASVPTARPNYSPGNGQTAPEQNLSDLRADLETVLRKIDPLYREILVLREMQQMTYDQIAQTLGVPRGTVESRLFRARAELRRRMKDYR